MYFLNANIMVSLVTLPIFHSLSPYPRCIAHGDTTEVVPRLLRVSMTEEEVQGAHNQQPDPKGDPRGPQGGVFC